MPARAAESGTVAVIQNRGVVLCGVTGTSAAFAMIGSDGQFRGIEVYECRAIAAAVLGDATKIRIVNLPVMSRLVALQSGEIDVLFANTTWTLGREASQGVEFAAIYFFDGQAFMVHAAMGAKTSADLNGASICMSAGGTSELNVSDLFRQNGMTFSPVLIESGAELRQAFMSRRCDVLSTDSSALAAFRSTLGAAANDFTILPERISNEPLAASVRKGDDRWLDVVRWTHNALVTAEALGVTAANVEQKLTSTDPQTRRLLGVEGNLGQQLGLDNRWALNAIRAVGNFGEVWDRSITPTGLPRGRNTLWTAGGLMYSPPMR